ncbi:MAG: hypothetical protein JST92_26755, partial [Deltaproteobacteria bacterium]|nr:hypothetical protein [Deltaproteobacteria bacterium]
RSLDELTRGRLMDAPVQVRLWRVPRSEVPQGAAARTEWLMQQWRSVDDFAAGRT